MTPGPAPLADAYREAPYWLEGVKMPSPRETTLPAEADAVVVGGGFTGVAAGWELARRGRSVVILERHRLGWGASTRNGGMVLPDVKHAGVEELRRRHGRAGPAMYEGTIEAVRSLEDLIREHAIESDYERRGHLELAHCSSAVPGLRRTQRVYREVGLEAEVLVGDRLGEEIGSKAYPAALAVELSGGLHPAKHFAGLARLALDAGARAFEHTAADAIEGRRGRFVVQTAQGPIRASDVLVATDGYTGPLVPTLRRRVLPVGSFIIATEPIDPERAMGISPRGRMFFDTRNFLSYWRLSPDGRRVLFGGRASFAPTTVSRARDFLYSRMVRVHPQLAGVGVDHAWGGTVGLTLDRFPRLGRTPEGLTYALGYSGTGVAASTFFGFAAARWIDGGEQPPFAGLEFPSIPLSWARPAWLPLVGLWFRWRDRC
ncbi:MAG: NAD(P)/FAD-dependent oxidoreductase [Actinomycetota bacterium]